jgi:medium-chain acyl-[acyl-carrier-protein] hydrolase
MSGLNMSFILQRFALSITRMPVYDETVKLRTWPDSVVRGTFLRKGDMHDESGNKLMEWTSMWILFDIAERRILKPRDLPVELPVFEDYGVKIMPEKIILPEQNDGELFSSYTHTVRYAEVDTNRHMNNSIYGDLIGNALFPNMGVALSSTDWREVQINYLAETRMGEEIEVTVRRENNSYLIIGKTSEKISFMAKVV